MKAYESMSYWDAYILPIPIRKWLITRHNKHVESEGQSEDPDKPLTQEERVRMINQAQQVQPKPLSARSFMTPTRNR